MCEYLLKTVVVGDMAVGKTCILLRYCDDTFTADYRTTIGVDFKMKSLTSHDCPVRMQLWDTAGQERFRTIVSSYYRGAHGLVIVYDVTDRNSFEKVPWWLQEAKSYGSSDCLAIMLGNKTDQDWKRQVSTEEGKALAKKHGMQFFETSAKESTNVKAAFEALVDAIVYRKRLLGGQMTLGEGDDDVIDIRSSEVPQSYLSCTGDLWSCSTL